MAEQAKVISISSFESFRAGLIVFISTAHRSLDEVGDDVRRTRAWLQHEQRMHWQMEIRRRQKTLDALEQEMYSARLSGLREVSPQQQVAVRKGKEAVREAEVKLRNVKAWIRNYDHCVDPLTRKLESLRHFLDHDMPKALAFLVQAQKTLEDYSDTAPVHATPAPATPEATE